MSRIKDPARTRLIGLREEDLVRLANSVRLRIARQVIEAVEPDGYLSAEELVEVIERIREMVRVCER